MDLLEYADEKGLQHIISWTKDGRAFVVHDPDRLSQLLPLFFGQTKYRSFQRQLHMWSFDRIVSGKERGARAHPYFIRGRRSILQHMTRECFKRKSEESETSSNSSKVSSTKKPAVDAVVAPNVTKKEPTSTAPATTTKAATAQVDNNNCDINEKMIFETLSPTTPKMVSSCVVTTNVEVPKTVQSSQIVQQQIDNRIRQTFETLDEIDKILSQIKSYQQQQQVQQQQVQQQQVQVQQVQQQEQDELTKLTPLNLNDYFEGDTVDFEGRNFFFMDMGGLSFTPMNDEDQDLSVFEI
jgi:glycerophosphoryl diester phosphodiesterase